MPTTKRVVVTDGAYIKELPAGTLLGADALDISGVLEAMTVSLPRISALISDDEPNALTAGSDLGLFVPVFDASGYFKLTSATLQTIDSDVAIANGRQLLFDSLPLLRYENQAGQFPYTSATLGSTTLPLILETANRQDEGINEHILVRWSTNPDDTPETGSGLLAYVHELDDYVPKTAITTSYTSSSATDVLAASVGLELYAMLASIENGRNRGTVDTHAELSSVTSPHEGDYVYVLDDDPVHTDETWRYDWADADGQGGYAWAPIVKVEEKPRDFTLAPIQTTEITDAAVTDDKIAAGAVDTAQLANSAVTNSKIDGGAVGSNSIDWGAVLTQHIEDGAVTLDKLAPDVLTEIDPGVRISSGAAAQAWYKFAHIDALDGFANPLVYRLNYGGCGDYPHWWSTGILSVQLRPVGSQPDTASRISALYTGINLVSQLLRDTGHLSFQFGYVSTTEAGDSFDLYFRANTWPTFNITALGDSPPVILDGTWATTEPEDIVYIKNQTAHDALTLQGTYPARFWKGPSNTAGIDINLGVLTNGATEYLGTIDYNETSSGNYVSLNRIYFQFYGNQDARNAFIQSGGRPVKLYKYTADDGFTHLWLPTANTPGTTIFPSARIEISSRQYAGSYFDNLANVQVNTLVEAPVPTTGTLIQFPEQTALTNKSYSLDEMQVGVWADGVTPVYRKTINFGALPNATSKSVALGFTPIHILRIDGVARNPANNVFTCLPHLSNDILGASHTIYVQNTNVTVYTTYDASVLYTECFITLEYIR